MLHLGGYKLSISTEELRAKAFAEFEASLGDIHDQTHYVVQAHLFLEQMLARIIKTLFPRGQELLDGAQWSFHNKLLMVHGLDLLDEETYEGLRRFNTLRNRIAHRLRYQVSAADVRNVAGEHANPELVQLAEQHPMTALQRIAISLLGEVGSLAVGYENLRLEGTRDERDA